jgi:hypothetical protein
MTLLSYEQFFLALGLDADLGLEGSPGLEGRQTFGM